MRIAAEPEDDTTQFAFTGGDPLRIPPAEEVTQFAFARPADAPAALPPAVASPPPRAAGPRRIGRYRLGEMIGRGGMSEVYAATVDDAGLGNGDEVAVKLLKPDLRDNRAAVAALEAQARALGRCDHPNIVRLVEAGASDEGQFVVTERVVGPSLGRLLREQGGRPLERERALVLLSGVAEALRHLHAKRMVHADVKPGNILVAAGDVPKLIDFGMPAVDGSGTEAVTPSYASPEIAAGATPHATDDVFSLAVLTYEMLSGRHPFNRQAPTAGMKPERPAGLTRGQWRALRRGLSLDRAGRPAGIAAFARPFVGPPNSRLQWLAVGAALLGLGVVAGLLVRFLGIS